MTQAEQSEFELVLGNKQLLSVFFIVVVLLAVFFFMGYVVGRNSGTAMAASGHPSTEAIHPATAPDSAARTSPMPPTTQNPPAEQPAQQQPSESQASAPEPAATAPPPKPEPHPAAAQPAETAAASPQSVGAPPEGTTWLQVVATTRPDAELIGETLSKRGFKTQVAPAPNGFFRVLVGPAKGAAEISDLRTRLEGAGFKNPIVRKY